MKHTGEIPVACLLSDAAFREREATLLAAFKSGVITLKELADGYAFRIPGDAKWIRLAVEVLVAERACCPFLTFEVTAHPNMGPLDVRITGPAGTRSFLKDLLCKPD